MRDGPFLRAVKRMARWNFRVEVGLRRAWRRALSEGAVRDGADVVGVVARALERFQQRP